MINVAGCAKQHAPFRLPSTYFQVWSNMSCTNCFHSLHQNGKRGLKPNRGSRNCTIIYHAAPVHTCRWWHISYFRMNLVAKGFWLSAFGGHSCIRLKREVLWTCKLCHWLLLWISIYSDIFVVLHHSRSKLEVLQRHREQTEYGLLGLWTGAWRPGKILVETTLENWFWDELKPLGVTWAMNVHLLTSYFFSFFFWVWFIANLTVWRLWSTRVLQLAAASHSPKPRKGNEAGRKLVSGKKICRPDRFHRKVSSCI